MAFTYNNTSVPFDANQPLPLMDIHQFVGAFQYPIDQIYIDKFWDGINDHDQWIIVDYEMLHWLGYDNIRDIDNKMQYRSLLESRFNQPNDYDLISKADERVITDHHVKLALNTIIVKARVFKKTLMMIHTTRAETVRDCYLLLEEIKVDYLQYSHKAKEHNTYLTMQKTKADADQRIRDLEQQLEDVSITFNISDEPVERGEHVYILTNKRYYKQCMFKIGKSIDLKSRLVSYNTGAAIEEDDMFYVAKIATFDARGLEKNLHTALQNYHLRKEWFRIPYRHIETIINIVTRQQALLCNTINELINQGFDDIENVPLEQFNKQPVEVHLPEAIHSTDATKQVCNMCGKDPTAIKPVRTVAYEKGALLKLCAVKAIIPRMTSSKLLQLNEAFVSERRHICKYCKKLHHVGCCDKYKRLERSSCVYICNAKIVQK
ncbi:hypothetical protein L917_14053 [Phytophthora nicotianae]|nr:hypothetical protein L917_14053 [Phytophthora nicotianae]ETO68400.1 hypothetical protein F444_14750 [Phytophthora nicotianae P1976]KUF84380.1 hypothetical protein AM587_10003898 [Phytophthora nicotianae]